MRFRVDWQLGIFVPLNPHLHPDCLDMTTQPRITILVVDDEPRMVRFVKMNLDL